MTFKQPLVLFFLAGVSALIYEICWVRQATLTFGVSVYAYSTVLTAYMGGMALGGYLIGRRADRSANPLRLFATLQLLLAVLGLAVPFALESALTGLYAWVARSLSPEPPLLNALRLLLSLLVLTPPAICIGAALPVMSRVYARCDGEVGEEVGRLYVVNTLGSVAGCLLTAIFLIRLLGTRATTLLASVINLGVAGMAWNLRPLMPKTKRPPPAPAPSTSTRAELRFILWAYAISGFAALGYEVVWARMIALYTVGAVYSFSIMLSVFLAGLVVGGLAGTWWLRRERRSPAVHCGHFGLLEIGVGMLAILTLPIFSQLHSLRLEHFFPRYSVAAEMAFEGLLSFITLFPVTTLMGAIFPIVSSLYTAERAGEVGLKIGRLAALNTAGSVLGSLLTGFVIIPLLGLQRSTLALAALNIGIGCAALLLFAPVAGHIKAVGTAVPVVTLVIALLLPPTRYLGYWQELADRLLFYKEGVETTVAVFEAGPQNPKFSTVNGRVEVPTDVLSLRAFYLLGHLPPLLRPDAQSALMLSFGNGIATGALSTHGIPQIEVVELSPEMIEAARVYSRENRDILSYPGLRVHVEDARNFLLQTERQYDIITTDATHPSNACSWALFTVEFYRQVAQHLAPGGVFLQWVPLHSIAIADYLAILRTFQSVFPYATLWYTGGSHTLLLATPQPVTGEYLAQRLNPPPLDAIADLGTDDIARYWIMDSEQLRQFAASGNIVRDDNAFFLPINAEMEQLIQIIQLAAIRRQH